MNTQQLQEIYNKSPEKWIVIRLNTSTWEILVQCEFAYDPNDYKLINIKHKQILEAYLADNNIYIERFRTNTTIRWFKEGNFIENYNPGLEYRLKYTSTCKECGTIFNEQATTYCSDECMKIGEKLDDLERKEKEEILEEVCKNGEEVRLGRLNNFQDYGFTGDFKGEILKEVDGFYIGYVKDDVGFAPTSERWTKEGKHMTDEIAYEGYNLTPIPKPWYEDEANFPALMTNGSRFRIASNTMGLLEDRERLATKEEVLSLYYEDK